MGDLLASKFAYIKLSANLFVALAVLLSLGILTNQVEAASSQNTIKFQGKVVSKSDGRNLIPGTPACVVAGAANDTCDLRVSLYDAASSGTLLWQEEHLNVEVGEYNGVFNLLLNSVCASWPALGSPPAGCTASPTAAGIDWSSVGDVYVQVEFAPLGAASYTETFSRKILTSVPFAQYAGDSGTLGGIDSEGFVQIQPAGGQDVNATTSDALIWLNETGTATPNLLQLQVGAVDRFVVTNDGLVEIGAYSSDSWLSLAASTAGRSQINFQSGVDPSAPNAGDFWWNGTALNFYDGAATANILNTSKFTDAGTVTYLTATTDDFAVGGSTLAASIFSVDVSAGDIFLGSAGSVDPSLVFENSSSQIANLDFTSTGNFNLTNAGLNVRLGINKAVPTEELDVVGDIQLTGDLLADSASSDIGTVSDPFANVYTVGLLAQGAATFEDVINVEGNILAAAPTLATGSIQTVDTTGNQGLLTDIAINNQGFPAIVYRDITASPERVRISVCSTAGCSGSVTSTSHDSAVNFTGNFANAIVIRSDNRPIFQFFNGSVNGGDPRIADCTNATCTASTIREPNNNVQIIGRYTDIIMRSNGFPLGVSHRNDLDNTQVYPCADVNCTSFTAVYAHDTSASAGGKQHISVVERTNQMPFITVYDSVGGDLRYINCTDSVCSTSMVGALLSTNNVGQWNRLALTKEGFPLIAHRNVTNQSVELVICKDYSCANFEQRVLADTGDTLGDLQLGLATKVDGSPVVSYYNTTNTSLYLYECHDPDCITGTNHRLTNSSDRGSYSSIVRKMGTNDEFTIAYYNATAGDLEVYNFAKSFTGGVSLGTATDYFKDLYVGKINTKIASISGFDVAEEYLVTDQSIEAGEVVRFSASSQASAGPENASAAATNTTDSSSNTDAKLLIEKTSSAYDEGLIGVVSTEPGLYLSNWQRGEEEKKKTRPVALVGRVPVKVSSENGSIKRGDLLTSSEKYPGYAMKATRGGYVVGRSMEDFGSNANDSQEATPANTSPQRTSLEIQELEKLKEFAISEKQSSMAAALELKINELKQLLAAEDAQASPEAKLGRVTMYVDLGYVPDQYYDAMAKGNGAENSQAGLTNALSGLGLEAQYLPEGSGSYFDGALQFVGKKGKLTLEDITVAGGLRVESDLIVKGVLTAGNLSTETLIIKRDLTLENFTGVAEILPGQTETIVKMPDISERSAVFVSSNGAEAWVERIMPGEGFVIKIDEAREEILKVNFAIINK